MLLADRRPVCKTVDTEVKWLLIILIIVRADRRPDYKIEAEVALVDQLHY